MAGRIMSMKNSNETIGNGTRDLPTCSAVPQPTAPPRGFHGTELPAKEPNKYSNNIGKLKSASVLYNTVS